jgi:hypothetical protein
MMSKSATAMMMLRLRRTRTCANRERRNHR